MAKKKGSVKIESHKKITSQGLSKRSRNTSKNRTAGAHAKKYRGQGR